MSETFSLGCETHKPSFVEKATSWTWYVSLQFDKSADKYKSLLYKKNVRAYFVCVYNMSADSGSFLDK